MGKELVISSNRHETKVAILEDDQLVEVYFQRSNEYSLAGSIQKGRVTRVLPGMQSAFVDIGLERDAFLYVSDFFEVEDEDEEFEPVAVPRMVPVAAPPQPQPQQLAPPTLEEVEQQPATEPVAESQKTPQEVQPDAAERERGWRRH